MIKNHKVDFNRTNAYLYTMLRVRKVKTKSGTTAIQVVQYTGHSAKIVKHIGSARDDFKLDLLITKVQEWIDKYTLSLVSTKNNYKSP